LVAVILKGPPFEEYRTAELHERRSIREKSRQVPRTMEAVPSILNLRMRHAVATAVNKQLRFKEPSKQEAAEELTRQRSNMT
jgi:hypothetical protein